MFKPVVVFSLTLLLCLAGANAELGPVSYLDDFEDAAYSQGNLIVEHFAAGPDASVLVEFSAVDDQDATNHVLRQSVTEEAMGMATITRPYSFFDPYAPIYMSSDVRMPLLGEPIADMTTFGGAAVGTWQPPLPDNPAAGSMTIYAALGQSESPTGEISKQFVVRGQQSGGAVYWEEVVDLDPTFDISVWHHVELLIDEQGALAVLDGTTSLTLDGVGMVTDPYSGLDVRPSIWCWWNNLGALVQEFDNFEFSGTPTPYYESVVDVDLSTLDKTKGKDADLLFAYITLPYNLDPASIDISKTAITHLSGQLLSEPIMALDSYGGTVGDYDHDGVPDLQVAFDKATVKAALLPEDTDITVQCTVYSPVGVTFAGTDVIEAPPADSGDPTDKPTGKPPKNK